MARSPPQTLENLSVDVLQFLGTWLELPEVCNVRLASKRLAGAFHHTFRQYFRSNTVKWSLSCLTEETPSGMSSGVKTSSGEKDKIISHQMRLRSYGLVETVKLPEAFAEVAHVSDSPTRHVTSLTFVGVVSPINNTSFSPIGTSLKDFTPNSLSDMCLDTIVPATPAQTTSYSITMVVQNREKNGAIVPSQEFKNWQHVWEAAARTFRVVTYSLAESSISIEKLDIFGSIRACSLSCDKLGLMLDTIDLIPSLAHLKYLSLSLSYRLVRPPKNDGSDSSYDGPMDVARFEVMSPSSTPGFALVQSAHICVD